MTNSELDILGIDNKIQHFFENQIINLEKYRKRLEELEKTFKNNSISVRSKTELEKSIYELRENINKIERREDYNFYLVESVEILEKYRQKLKTPFKLSFVGKSKQDDNEKLELVQKYLNIAQKYYKIELKQSEKRFKFSCDSCTNKKDFITEENAYICTECGSQQEILHHTTSYKDSDRVNISAKYTYDRKVHFRDCINQYQGKQNCSIEQKVYDKLEDVFERHHLLEQSEKREIRFSRITKEHVLMFLKELGFPKHYENVTLIHYNITGKKPDDISYLEEKLLLDFDILVETYDKHFKNKVERVNFISTQYVLFQLLQKYKHPCKKEDFIILKTMDRKSFHDTICRELFDILGWNFIPLY